MDKKLYYAYIANIEDLPEYYEKKCKERDIEIISKEIIIDELSGLEFVYYIVKAKEGLIDPKWELKD